MCVSDLTRVVGVKIGSVRKQQEAVVSTNELSHQPVRTEMLILTNRPVHIFSQNFDDSSLDVLNKYNDNQSEERYFVQKLRLPFQLSNAPSLEIKR